ncbi:MAG TPA: glycosyltransferase family 39 protein [Tepidisphaeraceae bacterium]|nr:glycosyltransferase family 39 protein [Tepidisphaeraceae bacterium]
MLLGPSLDSLPYGGTWSAKQRAEFIYGPAVARSNGERYFWLVTIARWACIPFALLGGYVCFAWAYELYGRSAGLLAQALWTFSPNVIAHGHLITPDMGATALGVAAAYVFWKWLGRPSWRFAIGAGLMLGLVELTKMTWVILFVLWPMLWIIYRHQQKREPGSSTWPIEAVQVGCILLIAIWIINLGYGFEGSFKRLGKYQFISESFTGSALPPGHRIAGNRFAGTWLGNIPVPLPEHYISGLDVQKADFDGKMWSYLRGQWRFGGWWYYYLYALLIKEPLGTWLLAILVVGATILIPQFYSLCFRDELSLIVPLAAILALVSFQTGFNHHLRYVLPIYPFAFIWISRIARCFELGHRSIAVLTLAALGWSILSSVSVFPHSLSYFNELVGGPKNGHFHLGNSNVDWGQDLLYLRSWYDQHPEARPFHVSYDLSLIDPSLVGIEHASPTADPRPGWYAISVNHLHRLGHDFDYFLEFKPVAMVGYSIYIYHINLDEANRVRRKLRLPELASDQPSRATTLQGGS